MAASLGIGVLHSITSLLLRHCKPHFRRYGALGEVEEALKRKLQEQPKDMMLREEVSLGYPRCLVQPAQRGSQCCLGTKRLARPGTALGPTTALDVHLSADLLVEPALVPNSFSLDVAAGHS